MTRYIIAIAAGFFLVQAGTASAADVQVVRGDHVSIVHTSRGGKVTVLRGEPLVEPKAAEAARERPAVKAPRIYGAGGVVWKIEADGSLSACWLQGNGYAGERVIRCSRR